jgi:hypothetical protein
LCGHLDAIIRRRSNHRADAGSRAGNGRVAIRRRRATPGAATPLSQARYDGSNQAPAATGFGQGTVRRRLKPRR